MVDDRALRAMAADHGLTGKYRVWREGERAYAWVKAFRNGEPAGGFASNSLRPEQDVFDFVVELLRKRIEDDARRGKAAEDASG